MMDTTPEDIENPDLPTQADESLDDSTIADADTRDTPAVDEPDEPDLVDVDDAGPVEEGPCPEGPFVTDCAFGDNSRQLRQSNTIEVTDLQTHTSAQTMDDLTGRQFVYGFACEGIFTPSTAAEAVQLTDDGVSLHRVVLQGNRAFTFFDFSMGDTVVGYIFEEGTFDLVARISDQDIVDCTVE
jgi:hypothetical protein